MPSAVPVIRTPRLTLRPLVAEDAEAIAAGVGNYDVSKWLSVVPYPYGIEDAQAFLRSASSAKKHVWAICDDDGLQGVVSIEAELGYWLARPAWGMGYGFEAAHAAVSWWFNDPDAGDLTSSVFDGNVRSAAVLSALAFSPFERVQRHARAYGQMVQTTRVRLSRTDWRARAAFEVQTDRLKLRPLRLEDAEVLLPLSAESIARQTASITPNWTVDVARDWLDQRLWRGGASGILGLFDGATFLGTVGAGGYPANVGWMILPDFWGRGYATEAVHAFLPAYFARTTFSNVAADVFEDNPASQAVARKTGFCETGRDMGTSLGRLEPQPVITYALTRDSLKDTA